MSCFAPCLITAIIILVAFIIAHIFLYIKLLEWSKQRYNTTIT